MTSLDSDKRLSHFSQLKWHEWLKKLGIAKNINAKR